MGQRLGLEIRHHGETLANCYYHWSGYTRSTLFLVADILEEDARLALPQDTIEQSTFRAVKLFEKTGAGVSDEERDAVTALGCGRDFQSMTSRSEGITSITEEGIRETFEAAEALAVIDFQSRTISFDAIHVYDKEDYLSIYDDAEETYEKLVAYHPDFDPVDFAFEHLPEMCRMAQEASDDGNFAFRVDDLVYSLIE